MKKLTLHLIAAVLAAAGCVPLPAQVAGQVELRTYGAGGMTTHWITPEAGKAFGVTGGGALGMITVGGGAGLENIVSGITGGTLTLGGTLSTGRTLTVRDQAGTLALTSDLTWSSITSTPTTLAGYGISDGITAAAVAAGYQPLDPDLTAVATNGAAYYLARGNHTGTQAWSTITSTPTTLAGYGISDGITAAAVAAGYQPLDADLTVWAGKTAPAGDVVGTSDAQTLTNKSIDAAQLSGTIAAARLPAPGTTTLGGVKRNAGTAGQYVSGVDTDGSLLYGTPSGGSGLDNLASGITGGTLTLGGTLSTGRTLTVRDQAGTLALTSDLTWSSITSTPTTLAGYGITDGITAAAVAAGYQPLDPDLTAVATNGAAYYLARGNHTGTQAWSTITSTPTTLAGYGITDGITAAAVAAGYQPLDPDLTAWAGKTAPAGDVVGTSDAQTLTNKSIDAAQLSGTIAAARLPAPGTTTLGGVKRNAGTAGQYVTGVDTDGSLLYGTPSGGGGLTNITETLHTASPNNTVNAEQLAVTGGSTNTDLVLTPQGTGAYILGPQPDGTTTGGNKRGAQSVDLQQQRAAANHVASGSNALLGPGQYNLVDGQYNTTLNGYNNTITGTSSQRNIIGSGDRNTISGVVTANAFIGSGGLNEISNNTTSAAIVGGSFNTVSANYGAIPGGLQNNVTAVYGHASGYQARSDRYGMQAHAAGVFAANGDAQRAEFVMRAKTTTNSAVELYLDGSSTRLTIPSGKVLSAIIQVTGIKSDGTAVAHYVRQYALKNAAGTTSQVYAAVTVGTDNAAGTSIAISADDTNDSLKIEATGVTSETWRWVARIDATEIAFGN